MLQFNKERKWLKSATKLFATNFQANAKGIMLNLCEWKTVATKLCTLNCVWFPRQRTRTDSPALKYTSETFRFYCQKSKFALSTWLYSRLSNILLVTLLACTFTFCRHR